VRFTPKLTGGRRWRAVVRILTQMRTVHPRRGLCLEFTGAPHGAPPGCVPWFDLPTRRRRTQVVCGHWAALGLLRRPDVLALDTGCVWGGALTAVRLDDGELFQQPCAERASPPR
jgi:bis(5'-nucleosyl)-tetraphosphatase (symmetrical)